MFVDILPLCIFETIIFTNIMNPELEKLLEYALADGQLSDKEKRVLFKKAEKLGVDPEELEIILEARQNSKLKEHENKVRKCAACGDVLKTLNPLCKACGYVNSYDEDDYEDPLYEEAGRDLDKLERDVENSKKLSESPKEYTDDIQKTIAVVTQKYGGYPGLMERINELSETFEEALHDYKKNKRQNLISWIIALMLLGGIVIGLYFIYANAANSPIPLTEKYIHKKNIAKAKVAAARIEDSSSREFYLFEIKLLEADSLVKIKRYDEAFGIINLIKDSSERKEKIDEVIEIQVTDLIEQKKYSEALEKAKTASYGTESTLIEKIEFAQKNTK